MKHFKKLLSCVLAAALALPIAAPAALADTQDRPWINDGTASDYKGGLSEIHWGSDWGEFAKLDFTGMADKTPDELAGMFDESKFNVITTDSILSFESDEGAFYTDAESDVDLSDLDYGAGEITFPAGDTVIISSAETTLKLIGETTLNIPDDSAVMVINTYQADPQGDDMLPTVIDSRTTLNINTNTSGKLAAVGLCGGAYTSWGIAAANLNVSGKGIVAAYGGKAENQSTGVYADYSISVKGASLVGVGASGSEGSLGIMTYDMQNEDGTFSDGIVSATDDAIIIGAGGAGLSYSYGIYTANTEARNNSSIFAYGANKAEDAQDDFYSAGLVDFIKDERTRTITADNGSNICACGRGSRSTGIDERYLGDAEKPDMEFGGIRILIDDSESEESSVITAYADANAYRQSRGDSDVDRSKFKAPTGSVKVIGSDNINGSTPNIVEFDPEEYTYIYNNEAAKHLVFEKGETADYSLYYNPADSSFYKSYDETAGYSDKIEDVPGASGDGEKLTLTSDFRFYTSSDLGLVLPEYTQIEVAADENPEIIAGSLTENEFTAGIYAMKGVYLKVDGVLQVSGGYGDNKDSFGIYSDGVLNISGDGILDCVGGCVNVISGEHRSVGIYARQSILVYNTLIFTYGGRIYADNEGAEDGQSIGIISGALNEDDEIDSTDGDIGLFDNAYVFASAGGGSGKVSSYGCVTRHVLVCNDAKLILNTYGESKVAIGLAIKLSENSSIDIWNNGSIIGEISGGDMSAGLSEVVFENEEFDGTKRILVNITDEGSMEFEGDTLAIEAARRMFGSISVTDGENNPLTYSSDEFGYVDSEGKPAHKAVIKGLPDADYAIFYSADTGFLKNNNEGEPLTKDEIPEGLSAEGNTITLNDVAFSTTKSCAFIAAGDVTLNIPKNSKAALTSFNYDPIDPADPEAVNVFGVELIGDSVIQADGSMTVSTHGTGRTFGLASYGNLTIKGEGEVIAAEWLGDDTSWALMSTNDLTIEDSAHVYAYSMATNWNKDTEPNVTSVMSRQLTVKDNAVLDTSGGMNSRSIGIWDGYDLVTEDNASVIANGSLILFGNADTKPGAIRASGNSTVTVECNYNGNGDNVLDWGIMRGSGMEGDAQVYVTDNASVSAYTVAENGGAISRTQAAGGVSVVGGNAKGDSGALEYKDGAYVIPGTDDDANYVLFRSAAVDYPLYFDGETGKLYKTFDSSFDVETGDVANVTYSDPIEVPGAICEGNKLTLTSDFQFYTDYMDGLYLGKGTTLYVPEGESPTVCGGFSGLTLGDGVGGSSGIYCLGDNTLEIDGDLEVIGCGGTNISSWGIVSSTKNESLNITGKGSLTARGEDIVYDETIEGSRGDSAGIVSYNDLNISIAELNAVGGDSYKISSGISVDYPSMEPHKITISGGAKVNAKGGVCVGVDDGDGYNVSIGCAANHVIIKDNSSLTATSSAADESYALVIYNWEAYGDGKIDLSDGSSLVLTALDSTYGCGIYGTEQHKPIIANMDKNCTFTAEGTAAASITALNGVTAVSDGKTVTCDSEKAGYVDADGNLVKKISFEAIVPEPTTAPSTHGGGGGFKPSSSAATPTASPAPTTESTAAPAETTAPEATAAPEETTAPAATQQPEPTAAPSTGSLPFTDVKPTDWFYNAVKAAYTEGLINGVTDTEFAPDATLTRGMLVTIVGRMGAAETTKASPFTDVDANAYYAPYVAWAAENGIVTGYGEGIFKPEENVTREQTAAILYRYMKNYIGADVSIGENTNILSYPDAADISEYAVPAIQWACGAGVIKGYPDGTLAPQSSITRAEFTSMISAISLY